MIIKPIKVENAGFDREVSYKEYAVNIRDKNTDKFINQYDCYETYDEALQSAKTIDLKDDEIYEIVEIEYDENGDELGINTITDSTLEECNSLKENYSLVGIYTDEHGMEKKDYIKDFDNKGDIDKYMADNEDELKAKNYDKIITESKKDDRFQANLSLHSKFGIDKGSKLIQELDTALEQSDKQKIKKLANKIKKELSPNDYNSFVKTYYPEYIDVLEEKEIKVTENSHKVNMIYTPIVEHKVITNRARKLKESLSQNEEDAIYSAGDFGELLDTLDNMKQDAKVQRARNLASHAYTHIPDEEEDEKLDEIKDEVISILTESNKIEDLTEVKAVNNIIWTNGFTLSKLRDAIKNDFDSIKETIDICDIEDREDGTSVYLAKYNGHLYLTLSRHNKNDYDNDFENTATVYVNEDKVANSTEEEFIKYINYLYKYLKGLDKPIRLGGKKTENLDAILTESLRDGWKPDVDLYTKLMKEMQDNLGISEYEIQKEADAIKFRYNGEVYFAEPRSTCQVDIFDDNHKQIGWGVVTDKIKQEVFTDYVTNQDFLYQLVGGEYAGTYTREEAEKLPIREPELTDDLDDIRARGGFVHRKELDNQFQFKGYMGPMWNGTKDGKGVIRYETPEVNDMLSR